MIKIKISKSGNISFQSDTDSVEMVREFRLLVEATKNTSKSVEQKPEVETVQENNNIGFVKYGEVAPMPSTKQPEVPKAPSVAKIPTEEEQEKWVEDFKAELASIAVASTGISDHTKRLGLDKDLPDEEYERLHNEVLRMEKEDQISKPIEPVPSEAIRKPVSADSDINLDELEDKFQTAKEKAKADTLDPKYRWIRALSPEQKSALADIPAEYRATVQRLSMEERLTILNMTNSDRAKFLLSIDE